MTRMQAEKQAMAKYVELWGEDFIQEHAGFIGSESYTRDDGLFEFRLIQWTPPPDEFYPDGTLMIKIGGESNPNHKTVFLFDLKAKTMEIIEHF